jgi:ferric-dicitrate binding protein FerR (iron transport regulator)
MPEKINWEYLIEKFAEDKCSKEELEQLLKFVEENHESTELTEALRNHWIASKQPAKASGINWEEKLYTILDEAKSETPVISLLKNPRRPWLKKWAVAASILDLFATAAYFLFLNTKSQSPLLSKNGQKPTGDIHSVTPGGNKAVLTLADGSVINLDSAKNGTLTQQGNIKIIKGEDGQLLYYVDQEGATMKGYNTISTPRGGKYQIVLADGSKVWLNAASSLKFPASFTGKAREVILTGEGYFEVAKNTSMPFHVKVNNMMVEVLGTHFNVNAYEDESSVATTLLEGSVKIKKDVSAKSSSQSLVLIPGDQAELAKDGEVKINHNANVQEVIAWKNDNFEFNNTPVTDIMRQVSRWYDVEIDYRGAVPIHQLTGKISRNVDLNQLIDMLKYTGINMKIENKKIIIWETDSL